MRLPILVCLLLPVLLPAQIVASRITEVTLFADRARVTREAALDLEAGVRSVELANLPAWVDPASVRARLLPGGEVLDVRSRLEFLSRTPDADVRAAEDKLQDLADRMAELEDKRRALEEKKQQIGAIRAFAAETLPADVPLRDIPVEYFRQLADFIHASTVGIDADRRALAKDIRLLAPELDAAKRSLADLQRGARLEQLHLALTLRPDAAGAHTLVVTYELPGASWEAAHEIRVRDGNRVSLVSLARIRQTSGEDWEDARFFFSTRRPGQTVSVPQLESLLLGKRTALNPMLLLSGNDDSWNLANRNYIDNNLVFNGYIQSGKASGVNIQGNWQRQNDLQVRAQKVFAQLEARGTTALFEAEGRFTVRSDGEEVRIPFARVEQEGELRILAAPELSPNAARGIELSYNHPQPLLPGDAALFVDGAFIGNTSLGFAGPGERFVLFAGSEDSLKLSRKLNHKESELRRGRSSNRMVVSFLISAENTGDRPLPLRLADRIPVSNDKDIKVSSVRIEPSITPGEDGLLTWETTIEPKSTRTFTLRYVVEYPTGLERRRSSSLKDAERSPLAGMPVDSAPASAVDQILDLEAKF
jgi:uncharacterized protein (TIGR02231 family)